MRTIRGCPWLAYEMPSTVQTKVLLAEWLNWKGSCLVIHSSLQQLN